MTNENEELDTGGEDQSESFVQLNGLYAQEPQYANFVSANYDLFAFHVAFSRLAGPLFESIADREKFGREGWSADVICRLVIPPEALRQIVGFLQFRLNEFDAQFEPDSDVELEQDSNSEDALKDAHLTENRS